MLQKIFFVHNSEADWTNRALWKVYDFTQKITKRLLLRAEDAILEVN